MLVPLWLLPNVLSLDAPAIAILWQWFLGAVFQLHIPMAARIALGLTVWAIYIGDRLLDARYANDDSLSARHAFHRRNFRMMLALMSIATLGAGVVSVSQVRPAVFRAGVGLAVVVLLYLYCVHRGYLRKRKELIVALLFAAGTAIAPITWAERKLPVVTPLLPFSSPA